MLGFFLSVFERKTKKGGTANLAAAGDTLLGYDPATGDFVGFDATTLGVPTVLTASLAAAGATMNGQVVLEDTGSATNVVVYGGGRRVRFTGTAF